MKPLPPPKAKKPEFKPLPPGSEVIGEMDMFTPGHMLIFPIKLGDCIDLLYEKRAQRLQVEKQVDVLKKDEESIRQHILSNFADQGIDGAYGKLATASVTETVVPTNVDWNVFWSNFEKARDMDLLERRIAKLAWRERYESGLLVPGTEPLNVVNLSLVKGSRTR